MRPLSGLVLQLLGAHPHHPLCIRLQSLTRARDRSGQAAAVAAASASERLEALEAALPPSMEGYCELLERHANGGASFAARQLLRLGCRLDLADASAVRGLAGRRGWQLPTMLMLLRVSAQARSAGALASELLKAAPGKGSFGAGGPGKQEAQLVRTDGATCRG
jgi:hypothetical protein